MVTKRPRVYADTSVFGGVFDEEYEGASRTFFDQCRTGRFELVLSALIGDEIEGAPENVYKFFRSVVEDTEILAPTQNAVRLRDAYLKAEIVGRGSATDALHVASATTAGCAIIVSWNFRHIVHYEKIALYNAINVREGYSAIAIHSPHEVIGYEDQDI